MLVVMHLVDFKHEILRPNLFLMIIISTLPGSQILRLYFQCMIIFRIVGKYFLIQGVRPQWSD
jgi:hypothetical protein